jgi:DNA-3-methyladenine glycosylase II
MGGMRVLSSDLDIEEGLAVLCGLCPHARAMREPVGEVPLRRWPAGFAGLMRIVISQQVSVASAAAIRGRVEAALGETSAEALLGLDPALLQVAGLSRGKLRTLRAAAEAVVNGQLQWEGDDLRGQLLALPGIGPWTADVYELFCLGVRDGFAAGDLALQEAALHGFSLEKRPKPAELEALVAHWRPWRGVGARLLWVYYAALKARGGI